MCARKPRYKEEIWCDGHHLRRPVLSYWSDMPNVRPAVFSLSLSMRMLLIDTHSLTGLTLRRDVHDVAIYSHEHCSIVRSDPETPDTEYVQEMLIAVLLFSMLFLY